MASEESESIDEETIITEAEEPTRLELKEMLVDIKIELSNIVRENNKLANEMAGLRNTIQEQKVELDSLKSLIIKVEKENNALETELSVARKRMDEQEEELAELYTLQDKLEQYTRKQSLEICGIPDSAYSSTEDCCTATRRDLRRTIVTRRHKHLPHNQQKRRRYHPSKISEPQSEKQILQSKNQIEKHQVPRCIPKCLDCRTRCSRTGPNFHERESHNLQKGSSKESER